MLVKVADVPWVRPPCRNPNHDPPQHIVLEPGVYEHTCPGCGQKQVFTIVRPVW